MRLILAVLLASCSVVGANPRVASSTRSAYLASERLLVEVTTNEARFTGTFRFRMPEQPDEFNRTNPAAVANISVWLPESPGVGTQEAAFWKLFNSLDSGSRRRPVYVSPENVGVLTNMLDLRFSVAQRDFPPIGFEVSSKRDEFLGEPGSCCLSVWFTVPQALLMGKQPVIISYRQPLLAVGGERRLFYVPEFFGLPLGTETTNRLYYSITVMASPDCYVSGSNGRESFAVEPRQSVTLTPRHYWPIRAVVKPRTRSEGAGGPRL